MRDFDRISALRLGQSFLGVLERTQFGEKQFQNKVYFFWLTFKQFLHCFPSYHFWNSIVIQRNLFFFAAVLSCVRIAVETSIL